MNKVDLSWGEITQNEYLDGSNHDPPDSDEELKPTKQKGIQVPAPKRKPPASRANDMFKTLDEVVEERGIQRPDKGKARAPSDDVLKTLNQVIRERGIKHPDDAAPVPPSADDVAKPLDQVVRERGIKINAASRLSSHSSESKEMDELNLGKREVQYSGTLTAYRAVGVLSASGMIVELVIGRLVEGNNDRSHLWRCIVKCGEIEGIADSVRKVVAREMASDNFLTRLKEAYGEVKIPRYAVVKEVFIDPRLFHLVEKEAAKKDLSVRQEIKVKPPVPADGNRKGTSYYTFVCIYYVGQKKCKGENYIIEYAKLRAVREAYKLVTGKYPEATKYFTGEDCDPSLEYEFSESEAHQTAQVVDNEEPPRAEDPQEARAESSKRAKKQEDDQ